MLKHRHGSIRRRCCWRSRERCSGRGQVTVERLPAIAGIHPSLVVPLELVAKAYPLGRDEAQGRIVDLDVPGQGWQPQIVGERICCAVCGDLLYLPTRSLSAQPAWAPQRLCPESAAS